MVVDCDSLAAIPPNSCGIDEEGEAAVLLDTFSGDEAVAGHEDEVVHGDAQLGDDLKLA